jgi:translation elongation factor EF-1alpha
MIDDRTLEQFEQKAKAMGRASWVFAWCLDTTDQERAKVPRAARTCTGGHAAGA